VTGDPAPRLSRELVALRVARLLQRGWTVNLGVGLPTLVAQFIGADDEVTLHVESGVLGAGPPGDPPSDPDLIDAQSQPITLLPGAAITSSAEAFAMVRGGHLDAAVLGGMQVSANADLANWRRPGKGLGGIGGAMDIAQGARRLIVAMLHSAADGTPRLVERCTLPLTARSCVDTVVTDVAMIRFISGQPVLCEVVDGWSADAVQAVTGLQLQRAAEVVRVDI
jgi:3-oxoacid CoA-transferase subunit B